MPLREPARQHSGWHRLADVGSDGTWPRQRRQILHMPLVLPSICMQCRRHTALTAEPVIVRGALSSCVLSDCSPLSFSSASATVKHRVHATATPQLTWGLLVAAWIPAYSFILGRLGFTVLQCIHDSGNPDSRLCKFHNLAIIDKKLKYLYRGKYTRPALVDTGPSAPVIWLLSHS